MNSSKSNQKNDKNTNKSESSITNTQTKTQIETKNDLSAEQMDNNTHNSEQSPISSIDLQLQIEKQRQEEEELALKLKLKKEKRNCIKLFLNDYSIIEIISSDYDSILSLCNEKDYLHKQFFNFLHDDKCLFYGCVLKDTNTIIGSVCIKIIDGGYTAQITGLIIDKNYINKNIKNILIEYVMNTAYNKYQSINRFRYINNQFEILNHNNTIGYEILNDIQFMYCILDNNILWFENKINKIHNEYINNKIDNILYNEYLCNFEELKCRDIDNIICILLYYYKQPHIFIEWNIFDLGINNEHQNDDIDDDSMDSITESIPHNDMDINDENITEDNSESEHENENENENEGGDEDVLGGPYEVIDNEDIEEEKQSILNREDRSRSTSISRSNDEDLYGDEQDISEDDETDNDNSNSNSNSNDSDNIDENINKYNFTEKDLCISSISDFKSYLFDFMNCSNIQVYSINTNDMNQENGALCIKYRNIKVRDKYTYYHIFGNQQMAIISIIYSCYYLWKKNIYNENNNENIQIFINKNVILNNDTLKWLFENTNNAYILERGIQNLDNDIYNDLFHNEK